MTCEQCYVCEQTVLQCSRTMLLAMTYDLCHGGHMVAEYPLLHTPHPLAQARACPSTGWALNRCFWDFLGPRFFFGPKCRIGCLRRTCRWKWGLIHVCDCAFCS